MSRVLLVAMDEQAVDLIGGALVADGHEVAAAVDSAAAVGVLDGDPGVDLMLLDLSTPRAHGLDVLRRLAGTDSPPTVIVLSPDAETDGLAGGDGVTLECRRQADGHAEHLLARVRGHLSATMPGQPVARTARYLAAGGVSIDLDRRRARHRGADVALSDRELALLAHLMRHRGSVCRRDDLLHHVWGLDFDPGTNVVDVCMRRLRAKLVDLPIETVRGTGYCFYGE